MISWDGQEVLELLELACSPIPPLSMPPAHPDNPVPHGHRSNASGSDVETTLREATLRADRERDRATALREELSEAREEMERACRESQRCSAC